MSNELTLRPSGRDRMPQVVEAYAVNLGPNLRPQAAEAMKQAGALFDANEDIVAICQAQRRDAEKGKVVLVLTQDELVVVDERRQRILERFPRARVETLEWRTDFMWGFAWTVSTPSGNRCYKQPLPEGEALRFAVLCGLANPWDRTLLGGRPQDPGCPPMAFGPNLTLYPDRLVDGEARHLPFDGPVETQVDSAGNIEVTRGRNLAMKAGGTMVFGPLGLLFAGNAKHRHIDNRELYLLIEGPTWAVSVQCDPNAATYVRQFAGKVSAAARQFVAATAPPTQPVATASDPVERLAKLAELHQVGALTDEEFAAAKARLLGL